MDVIEITFSIQKHCILEKEEAKLNLYFLFYGVLCFLHGQAFVFHFKFTNFKFLKHSSFFDFPLNG